MNSRNYLLVTALITMLKLYTVNITTATQNLTVYTAMSTVRSSAHLGRTVDLDVFNDQMIAVQSLHTSTGPDLSVLVSSHLYVKRLLWVV